MNERCEMTEAEALEDMYDGDDAYTDMLELDIENMERRYHEAELAQTGCTIRCVGCGNKIVT